MTLASDNKFPKVIITEGSAPSSPSAGDFKLYVDSGDHLFKMKNSSGTVTTFGTGLADPMTTRGDIVIRDSSNTTARLGRGTSGQVLTSDGTDIAWQTPSAGGGITHAYVGYNTIGGSTEAPTAQRVYMKKITLANDCMLNGLDLYLDQSADQVAGLPTIALWTDNSGVPLTLIHHSGPADENLADDFYLASSTSSWPARWIGVGTFGKWLTAGDYWIGWMFNDVGALRMYYDSGSDRYFTSGNPWLANGDRYSQTDSTRKYSARVSTIR